MNKIYMHFRVRKIFNNCCIYYYYHEYTTTISEKLVNEITKKRRLFITFLKFNDQYEKH